MAVCCWEALASRVNHRQCLPSIHLTAKSVRLSLASHLAQEVPSLLRTVKEHPIMTMYDDETVHLLLCQLLGAPQIPGIVALDLQVQCYQNRGAKATVQWTGESHCTSKAGYTDWIGGMCPADTLLVWFPAHWVPIISKAINDREQKYTRKHTR